MFNRESSSSRRSFGSSRPRRSGGGSGRSSLGTNRRTDYGRRPMQKRFTKSWSTHELMRVIEERRNNDNHIEVAEYVVKNSFASFNISPKIKQNIIAQGYTHPTPIQDQAITVILDGKDLIGIANTGTGKTAAFLIPLIEKASKRRDQKIIIMTPTRELAFQIYEEFRHFSKDMGIYAALVIGGANVFRQRQELRKNPNFVIGTPGRLKDFIQQKVLDLSTFNNVVLDEADRMVDIGFIKEMEYIIGLLPKERQSLFFSATLSPKVNEILKIFVKNPVTVSVKQQETAANVEQKVVRLNGQKKIEVLHDLLIKDGYSKVLVFGRTKWGVQELSDELQKRGFKAGAIHGNKRQNQRQLTLTKFKKNEIQILLATDVASRGLDIKDVSHVINYDMPECYEDYVHRIGRTGRANKKGIALTFVE